MEKIEYGKQAPETPTNKQELLAVTANNEEILAVFETEALAQVHAEAKAVLNSVDSQLAAGIPALDFDQAAAEKILEDGGFKSRIESLRQRINTLVASTGSRLRDIAKQSIENPSLDLNNPRSGQATEKISRSLERLATRERVARGELLPKETLIADADHIENQQIDIIQGRDGDLRIAFKVTEKSRRNLEHRFAVTKTRGFFGRMVADLRNTLSGSTARKRKMTYTSASGYTLHEFTFGCMEKETKTGKIQVADSEFRSTFGLVEITIPADIAQTMSAEEVHTEVARILNEEMGIPQGTYEPTKEAEQEYKKSRYKWHHKTREVPQDIEKRLTRKEVAPGYHTFVEEGKHKEYAREGEFAVFHHINSGNSLAKIISSGGLFATHERYRRGLMVDGMSSIADMRSGGADSVFTRTISADKKTGELRYDANIGNAVMLFEPRIFDRTDWYAYASDSFGSTREEVFKTRLSPEELLKHVRSTSSEGNEQMFRTAIAIEDVKAIAVFNKRIAKELYRELRFKGITEINGRPIEEMIVIAPNQSDLLALTAGRKLANPVDLESTFAAVREEEEFESPEQAKAA